MTLVENYDAQDRVSVRLPASYAGLQDLQLALRAFIAAPEIPVEIEIR